MIKPSKPIYYIILVKPGQKKPVAYVTGFKKNGKNTEVSFTADKSMKHAMAFKTRRHAMASMKNFEGLALTER